MNRHFSRRTFFNWLPSFVVLASIAGMATGTMARADTQQAAMPDWQAGAPAEWHKVMKAARAEGELTVGGFPYLAKKMTAAFKRDTGIKLNWFGGRSSQISSRFVAEARAKNITIDVILGGGRELKLISEGLMNPIKPQLMLPGVSGKNFRGGKLKWMDNQGKYFLVGAEWVFGWLLVNKDIVDPSSIKNWKDILDPKYRGKIISHDPRSPGPGQGATSWLYNTFGIEFVKSFHLGQKVKFTRDNRQVVESVVRGTTPIAFGSLQTFIERFKRKGIKNLAVVLPADAPGYVTGGFSVLKQAKGVPHPNAAKVFINWYMSRPGQEVYQSIMLATSRRLDVKTGLPDYVVPKDGIKYFEAYNEKIYNSRKIVIKAITDALGKR
jgi:ABC-type Fe3+ transport system substrate-binding protein